MIGEPEISCECDECGDTEIIKPRFVFYDYSGDNGTYDCSDEAIIRELKKQGWAYSEGVLFCDDCAGRCKK